MIEAIFAADYIKGTPFYIALDTNLIDAILAVNVIAPFYIALDTNLMEAILAVNVIAPFCIALVTNLI